MKSKETAVLISNNPQDWRKLLKEAGLDIKINLSNIVELKENEQKVYLVSLLKTLEDASAVCQENINSVLNSSSIISKLDTERLKVEVGILTQLHDIVIIAQKTYNDYVEKMNSTYNK